MSSPRSLGELNEISVACSTPLKSSLMRDRLEWSTSPVSKILSPEQRNSYERTSLPSRGNCNRVLFEIDSSDSDDELILPTKRSRVASKQKKKSNTVCSKQMTHRRDIRDAKSSLVALTTKKSSDSTSSEKLPVSIHTADIQSHKVTSNSLTNGVRKPITKNSRSQRDSMTIKSLHTTIAEISNIDGINTLDGLHSFTRTNGLTELNTSDSAHSSRKSSPQSSPIDMDKKSGSRSSKKEISSPNKTGKHSLVKNKSGSQSTNKEVSSLHKSYKDSVVNRRSGSQRTNKEICLPKRYVKDSVVKKKSGSRSSKEEMIDCDRSVEDSGVNKNSESQSTNKEIGLPNKSFKDSVNKKSGTRSTNKEISMPNGDRSVPDSVIIEPHVRVSNTKQGRCEKSVGQRKSTRWRALPTDYWKHEAPKYFPSEIFSQNNQVQHPKVVKLRATAPPTPRKQEAVQVLLRKPENSTNKMTQRKETSTTKKLIENKNAVTCAVFSETEFETIDEFQHKDTMDVFGLSAGFYRLPPGAQTGHICCDLDSQLYTVVLNEIVVEIDGISKELKCFDQLHVMKGVSHTLSNRSNHTGLVQYVNVNSK